MQDLTPFFPPCLSDPANMPSKRHLGGVPKRSLPDRILNRPKTGFSIPVREWLEEKGDTQGQRGLRGWSLLINDPKSINAGAALAAKSNFERVENG
jgi:asparagine synthase (glutamine-hydrolysing)